MQSLGRVRLQSAAQGAGAVVLLGASAGGPDRSSRSSGADMKRAIESAVVGLLVIAGAISLGQTLLYFFR